MLSSCYDKALALMGSVQLQLPAQGQATEHSSMDGGDIGS